MTSTANLGLALLQPSQAQKHVTVNEALGRLDALCQLVLEEIGAEIPPATPQEGAAHALGAAPVDAWAGQAGQVALFLNGGWVFVTPRAGWRAWVAAEAAPAVFDGTVWQARAVAVSTGGAATLREVVEADIVLGSGTVFAAPGLIPAGTVVDAVTGRVMAEVTGTATSWRIGVPVSTDRYGTSYGLAQGSTARGLTGQPQAYYADTDLQISAEGGSFTGGAVRIAVHLTRFTLPRG